jgi:hypothetical protein
MRNIVVYEVELQKTIQRRKLVGDLFLLLANSGTESHNKVMSWGHQ